MNWSITVFLSRERALALCAGEPYYSGDPTDKVRRVLDACELPLSYRFTSATLTRGNAGHPAGAFALNQDPVEARIVFERVATDILVVTERDLHDVCCGIEITRGRVSPRDRGKLISPGDVESIRVHLNSLSNIYGGRYPEVRINRGIVMDDVEGFYKLDGSRIGGCGDLR